MKFFAAIVLIALIAVVAADDIKLTAEQKAKAEAIVKDCIKETGANADAVTAMINGDFSKVGKNEKCFTKCCQTKLGYVSNGAVKEDAVQKSLGPIAGEEKVKAIQAKCNGSKGTDDCDTSFQLHKCYFNAHAALTA